MLNKDAVIAEVNKVFPGMSEDNIEWETCNLLLKAQEEAAQTEERQAILSCVKYAKEAHPEWGIDDVIDLLEFRTQTAEAILMNKKGQRGSVVMHTPKG